MAIKQFVVTSCCKYGDKYFAVCCANLLDIYKVVSQKQACESPDDDDLSPTSPGPRSIGVSSAAGLSADQHKKSCCSTS